MGILDSLFATSGAYPTPTNAVVGASAPNQGVSMPGAGGAGLPPGSQQQFAGGGFAGGGFGGGGEYGGLMHQALQKLEEEEQMGRGSLSQYYQQSLGYGAPYREAGQQGLTAYLGSLGLGGAGAQKAAIQSFRESPGYQFAMQQGLQGVKRGEAARGLGGSGAEMRQLQQTGQGIAGQQYGQFQQRLAGLAGMGGTAAQKAATGAQGMGGSLAQLGEYYGGASSQLYSSIAKAQAEQAAAEAQEKSSMWGGIGSLVGSVGQMAALL